MVIKIEYTKAFLKAYAKRIEPFPNIAKNFEKRLSMFIEDPQNPILRDHKLVGKLNTFRSFSIAGDLRVIYYSQNNGKYILCTLIDIGSHNQVYD